MKASRFCMNSGFNFFYSKNFNISLNKNFYYLIFRQNSIAKFIIKLISSKSSGLYF